MSSLKLEIGGKDSIELQWAENLKGDKLAMATAAVATMEGLGALAKVRGRVSIAGAGFGLKWQNALRVDVYPNHGLDAAVRLWHKIPYANIFEDGGDINGAPTLWLPVKNLQTFTGSKRITPSKFERLTGQKLVYYKGPTGTPILGVRIRVNRKGSTKLSLTRLKRGEGSSGSKGVVDTVPVFVGLSKVRIPRKFGLEKMMEGVGGEFAGLYVRNMEAQ